MDNTGHGYSMFETIELCGCLLLVFAIVAMYLRTFYIVYMKNRDDLEPMHIFQLNFLMAVVLRSSFPLMEITRFGMQNGDSCWHYFFGLFSLICFNTDLLFGQFDRFLAIYWNVEYKGRITTKMAKIGCIVSKLFGLMLTIMVALLDPTYGKCMEGYELLKGYELVKTANICLDAYPKLFAAFALSFVSIYAALTKVKLDKKVSPVVNLPSIPSVAMEFQESDEDIPPHFKIGRKDDDPNIFYQIQVNTQENEDDIRKNENSIKPNHSAASSSRQAILEILENQVDHPLQCFNINKEILLVAKKTLTINLITSLLLIVIIPNRILAIIYYHMNAVSGNEESYMLISRIMNPFIVISSVLHPLLILKKLNHN